MYSKNKIDSFIKESPILKEIIDLSPVIWLNPNRKIKSEMPAFPIKKKDMDAAAELWERFAPFFVNAFPQTAKTNGILESPLKELENMKALLNQESAKIQGRFFLKCDNALPIAGSIKARGGFFEVLHYAEDLALNAGILKKSDSYAAFTTDKFKQFFSKYKIGVGSTGNLGLSIGIISAKLGFQVTVYVSGDAKKWKKDLLRANGVEVIEFAGDFSEAILAGRQKNKCRSDGVFCR
jgi:D-serine dehydratase